MKTIQEIYEQESIRLIEDAIFEACREHERMKFADPYGKNVTRLLKIRKELLDREFVMDEQYKGLLSEFNEALKKALLTMRTQTIAAVETLHNASIECDINVTGKCFLDSHYRAPDTDQTCQENVGDTVRWNYQLYTYVRRRCRCVVWIRQKFRF